jgi:hypothetical protein
VVYIIVKLSLLFFILGIIFFTIAALAEGGVITMSQPGWLVPGGLAAVTIGFILG